MHRALFKRCQRKSKSAESHSVPKCVCSAEEAFENGQMHKYKQGGRTETTNRKYHQNFQISVKDLYRIMHLDCSTLIFSGGSDSASSPGWTCCNGTHLRDAVTVSGSLTSSLFLSKALSNHTGNISSFICHCL